MTRALHAFAVALLAAAAVVAEPSIEVSLEPAELTVGDRVELVVTVRTGLAGAGNDVRFQSWGETLGPAEVLGVSPIERIEGPDDSAVFRQRLSLTLFRVGEVTLPPIEATLIGPGGETPLTSVSPRLVVNSVLPAGSEELEAKPLAPPRRLGLGERFWWAAAALLATCLVAIVALWRHSGELVEDGEGRPRLAPMEELRRSLATLRSETEIPQLHAELSLAVRRFLGRVMKFQARESTTTEIRRELSGRRLPADVLRQTSDLLSACDMVKFARLSVDRDTAQSRIGMAQTLAGGVAAALASVEPVVDVDVKAESVEPKANGPNGQIDVDGVSQ